MAYVTRLTANSRRFDRTIGTEDINTGIDADSYPSQIAPPYD